MQFQATHFVSPSTVEQLQEIVRAASQVRVVGAGHSFNTIANSQETLVSLHRLEPTVEIDREQRTATISAGLSYIDVIPYLDKAGFALANLSSTPHVTVIGSCMTATHGSGDKNKILSDQVSAMEIVTAEGELVQLSRRTHGEKFNGMVVALGALGVVTTVTLDLVPAYLMQHEVYRNLPLAEMGAHFDEIMASAYSVSLGTAFQNKIVNLVWIKRKLPDGMAVPVKPTLHGATPAEGQLLANAQAHLYTFSQNGVPAPWYERLPSFHIRSTLNGANERQSEYFVSRSNAVAALMAVESLGAQMAPFIKISEIRTIAADDHWLSPAYKQDCVGIHFSWSARPMEIERFLPVLEDALAPYQPRPHWGKLFTMPPADVQARFERMADFRALMAEFDPTGKFRNLFVTKYIGLDNYSG